MIYRFGQIKQLNLCGSTVTSAYGLEKVFPRLPNSPLIWRRRTDPIARPFSFLPRCDFLGSRHPADSLTGTVAKESDKFVLLTSVQI